MVGGVVPRGAACFTALCLRGGGNFVALVPKLSAKRETVESSRAVNRRMRKKLAINIFGSRTLMRWGTSGERAVLRRLRVQDLKIKVSIRLAPVTYRTVPVVLYTERRSSRHHV